MTGQVEATAAGSTLLLDGNASSSVGGSVDMSVGDGVDLSSLIGANLKYPVATL